MPYRIQYSPEAEKILTGMEKTMAHRIVKKINELAEDPHNAGNVKPLKGKLKGFYRLRAGDYRVLYRLKDEVSDSCFRHRKPEEYLSFNRTETNKMENAQIITSHGLPQFAVIPYQQYLELMAKAEGYADVEDYLDYHRATQVMESTTKWISSEEVERKIGLRD